MAMTIPNFEQEQIFPSFLQLFLREEEYGAQFAMLSSTHIHV